MSQIPYKSCPGAMKATVHGLEVIPFKELSALDLRRGGEEKEGKKRWQDGEKVRASSRPLSPFRGARRGSG